MSIYLEERADDGLALYIEGDLQFDTRDEALYHESIALPALSILRKRNAECPLKVLICGGGDGLALREVLRFPNVEQVDLVDYSDDVVGLAQTKLAALNNNAFADPRVSTHIMDAWEFLSSSQGEGSLSSSPWRGEVGRGVAGGYHVIICDFTVPRRPGDSRVYSQEWFKLLRSSLAENGIVVVNSFSPHQNREAFWCLQKTIHSSGLHSVPYRVCIPSFFELNYGIWSFTLCSPSLKQAELHNLECPVETTQANLAMLRHGARFSKPERALLKRAKINTIDNDILLPLLLNPGMPFDGVALIDDSVSVRSPYNLDPLIQAIPLSHPYHTRTMIETLAHHVTGTIRGIDIRRLVDALLRRASELPQRLRTELINLKEFLRDHLSAMESWSTWCYRLFAVLLIIMTIANSIAPDSAFAKGFFGGHGGSFSSGVSHGGGSFGRSGGFGGGGSISSVHVTGSGFRSGYRSGHMTDITGHVYTTRVFYYHPIYHDHYYGYGYNPNPVIYNNNGPNQPNQQEQHKSAFVADSDLLVLENGDLSVVLSDKAYLLITDGHVMLMNNDSPDPLAFISPDSGLIQAMKEDLANQTQVVENEMDNRKDWLSWVGWTKPIVPAIKNDTDEYNNLKDLKQRIAAAVSKLDNLKIPANQQSIALGPGEVQLFAGGVLRSNGVFSIRTASGSWMNTNGVKIWNGTDINSPASGSVNAPDILCKTIRGIIDKRTQENVADMGSLSQDEQSLNSDLASLQKDYAEYQSLYYQYNDPNYEVDYGSDTVTVSTALSKTQSDLDECKKEISQTEADRSRMSVELGTLRTASSFYK